MNYTNTITAGEISTKEEATEFKNPKAGFYDKYLDKLTDFFSFARVFTYFPTIFVLYSLGNSDQYSLLTWYLWILANSFTAAKIYKMNDYKYNGLVIANIANTMMCLITVGFIVYYRMI